MHQNVPDKVVAKVHDKETNMTGSQKLSENVGVARWSAIGAAVVVALSVSACGGGGGGGDSGTTTPAAAETTSGTVTDATTTTTTTTTATGNATSVTFAPVIRDASGNIVTAATISIAVNNANVSDDYDGNEYSLTIPVTDLASTSTVTLTITADGYKTKTLPYTTANLTAGNSYSTAVTLEVLDAVSLAVTPLNPSSVYLGDGVPADKLSTNKFNSAQPLGLSYVVDLGSMPTGVEGRYSKLAISMQILGLDSASCPGNQITVYQSATAAGTRVGEQTLRMGASDAATAAPYEFTFNIPASSYKAASGKLFAVVAVDAQKCAGGTEYDDFEFSGVTAKFTN